MFRSRFLSPLIIQKNGLGVFVQKFQAIFLLICFLSQSLLFDTHFAYSQTFQNQTQGGVRKSNPTSTLGELLLPPELGDIEESYFSGDLSKGTIIYIQDAHISLEAQENISKIIHYLVENQNVQTVFQEGYEGKVPTEKYFDSLQSDEDKKHISYYLLDHLKLGGAEYAHIHRKKDFELVGVEDEEVYKENFYAYQNASKIQSQVEKDLQILKYEFKNIIHERFSNEFKEWLNLFERYHQGKLDLFSYLNRSSSNLSKGEMEKYPNLYLLLESTDSLDLKKQISFQGLFKEIKDFEIEIQETLLKDVPFQREVAQYYFWIEIFEKLNRMEMTFEEFSVFENLLYEELEGFTQKAGELLFQLKEKTYVFSKQWESNILKSFRFYEIAIEREKSLERNMTSRSNFHMSALVFGGFHKEAIKEILKRHEYSYHIIAPKISELNPKHSKLYKHLMSGGVVDFKVSPILERAMKTFSSMVDWEEGEGVYEAALHYSQILGIPVREMLQRMSLDPALSSETRKEWVKGIVEDLPEDLKIRLQSNSLEDGDDLLANQHFLKNIEAILRRIHEIDEDLEKPLIWNAPANKTGMGISSTKLEEVTGVDQFTARWWFLGEKVSDNDQNRISMDHAIKLADYLLDETPIGSPYSNLWIFLGVSFGEVKKDVLDEVFHSAKKKGLKNEDYETLKPAVIFPPNFLDTLSAAYNPVQVAEKKEVYTKDLAIEARDHFFRNVDKVLKLKGDNARKKPMLQALAKAAGVEVPVLVDWLDGKYSKGHPSYEQAEAIVNLLLHHEMPEETKLKKFIWIFRNTTIKNSKPIKTIFEMASTKKIISTLPQQVPIVSSETVAPKKVAKKKKTTTLTEDKYPRMDDYQNHLDKKKLSPVILAKLTDQIWLKDRAYSRKKKIVERDGDGNITATVEEKDVLSQNKFQIQEHTLDRMDILLRVLEEEELKSLILYEKQKQNVDDLTDDEIKKLKVKARKNINKKVAQAAKVTSWNVSWWRTGWAKPSTYSPRSIKLEPMLRVARFLLLRSEPGIQDEESFEKTKDNEFSDADYKRLAILIGRKDLTKDDIQKIFNAGNQRSEQRGSWLLDPESIEDWSDISEGQQRWLIQQLMAEHQLSPDDLINHPEYFKEKTISLLGNIKLSSLYDYYERTRKEDGYGISPAELLFYSLGFTFSHQSEVEARIGISHEMTPQERQRLEALADAVGIKKWLHLFSTDPNSLFYLFATKHPEINQTAILAFLSEKFLDYEKEEQKPFTFEDLTAMEDSIGFFMNDGFLDRLQKEKDQEEFERVMNILTFQLKTRLYKEMVKSVPEGGEESQAMRAAKWTRDEFKSRRDRTKKNKTFIPLLYDRLHQFYKGVYGFNYQQFVNPDGKDQKGDPLELELFQLEGIHFFLESLNHPRMIIGDEMGAGKTPQLAVSVAASNANTILGVAPLGLLENIKDEFKNWLGWDDENILVLDHKSADAKVKAIQKRVEEAKKSGKKLMVLVSYQSLQLRPKKENKVLREFISWAKKDGRFDFKFADEAHALKDPTSQQSKGFRELPSEHLLFLTGTGIVNSVDDLWSMLSEIEVDSDRFKSKAAFVEKYGKDHLSQIRLSIDLKERYFLRRALDWVKEDLPEKPKLTPIPIKLSEKQTELHEEMIRQYSSRFDQASLDEEMGSQVSQVEFSRVSRIQNLHREMKQMIIDLELFYNGEIPEGYSKEDLISPKFQAAVEKAQEIIDAGEQLVIFSGYQAVVEKLTVLLQKKLGKKAVGFMHGGIEKKFRDKLKDDFQDDDEPLKVLVSTYGVGGQGLTLTKANHVLFVDLPYTQTALDQAIGRVYRHGQEKEVQVYHLHAEGTVDDDILEIIEKKRTLFDRVMNGNFLQQENEKALEELHHKTLRKTVLQRIREALAYIYEAQIRGDVEESNRQWKALSKLYSDHFEGLAAFPIEQAIFFHMIHLHQKGLIDLKKNKKWLNAPSGPASMRRVFASMRNIFKNAGLDVVSDFEFDELDKEPSMHIEGNKAMNEKYPETPITATQQTKDLTEEELSSSTYDGVNSSELWGFSQKEKNKRGVIHQLWAFYQLQRSLKKNGIFIMWAHRKRLTDETDQFLEKKFGLTRVGEDNDGIEIPGVPKGLSRKLEGAVFRVYRKTKHIEMSDEELVALQGEYSPSQFLKFLNPPRRMKSMAAKVEAEVVKSSEGAEVVESADLVKYVLEGQEVAVKANPFKDTVSTKRGVLGLLQKKFAETLTGEPSRVKVNQLRKYVTDMIRKNPSNEYWNEIQAILNHYTKQKRQWAPYRKDLEAISNMFFSSKRSGKIRKTKSTAKKKPGRPAKKRNASKEEPNTKEVSGEVVISGHVLNQSEILTLFKKAGYQFKYKKDESVPDEGGVYLDEEKKVFWVDAYFFDSGALLNSEIASILEVSSLRYLGHYFKIKSLEVDEITPESLLLVQRYYFERLMMDDGDLSILTKLEPTQTDLFRFFLKLRNIPQESSSKSPELDGILVAIEKELEGAKPIEIQKSLKETDSEALTEKRKRFETFLKQRGRKWMIERGNEYYSRHLVKYFLGYFNGEVQEELDFEEKIFSPFWDFMDVSSSWGVQISDLKTWVLLFNEFSDDSHIQWVLRNLILGVTPRLIPLFYEEKKLDPKDFIDEFKRQQKIFVTFDKGEVFRDFNLKLFEKYRQNKAFKHLKDYEVILYGVQYGLMTDYEEVESSNTSKMSTFPKKLRDVFITSLIKDSPWGPFISELAHAKGQETVVDVWAHLEKGNHIDIVFASSSIRFGVHFTGRFGTHLTGLKNIPFQPFMGSEVIPFMEDTELILGLLKSFRSLSAVTEEDVEKVFGDGAMLYADEEPETVLESDLMFQSIRGSPNLIGVYEAKMKQTDHLEFPLVLDQVQFPPLMILQVDWRQKTVNVIYGNHERYDQVKEPGLEFVFRGGELTVFKEGQKMNFAHLSIPPKLSSLKVSGQVKVINESPNHLVLGSSENIKRIAGIELSESDRQDILKLIEGEHWWASVTSYHERSYHYQLLRYLFGFDGPLPGILNEDWYSDLIYGYAGYVLQLDEMERRAVFNFWNALKVRYADRAHKDGFFGHKNFGEIVDHLILTITPKLASELYQEKLTAEVFAVEAGHVEQIKKVFDEKGLVTKHSKINETLFNQYREEPALSHLKDYELIMEMSSAIYLGNSYVGNFMTPFVKALFIASVLNDSPYGSMLKELYGDDPENYDLIYTKMMVQKEQEEPYLILKKRKSGEEVLRFGVSPSIQENFLGGAYLELGDNSLTTPYGPKASVGFDGDLMVSALFKNPSDFPHGALLYAGEPNSSEAYFPGLLFKFVGDSKNVLAVYEVLDTRVIQGEKKGNDLNIVPAYRRSPVMVYEIDHEKREVRGFYGGPRGYQKVKDLGLELKFEKYELGKGYGLSVRLDGEEAHLAPLESYKFVAPAIDESYFIHPIGEEGLFSIIFPSISEDFSEPDSLDNIEIAEGEIPRYDPEKMPLMKAFLENLEVENPPVDESFPEWAARVVSKTQDVNLGFNRKSKVSAHLKQFSKMMTGDTELDSEILGTPEDVEFFRRMLLFSMPWENFDYKTHKEMLPNIVRAASHLYEHFGVIEHWREGTSVWEEMRELDFAFFYGFERRVGWRENYATRKDVEFGPGQVAIGAATATVFPGFSGHQFTDEEETLIKQSFIQFHKSELGRPSVFEFTEIQLKYEEISHADGKPKVRLVITDSDGEIIAYLGNEWKIDDLFGQWYFVGWGKSDGEVSPQTSEKEGHLLSQIEHHSPKSDWRPSSIHYAAANYEKQGKGSLEPFYRAMKQFMGMSITVIDKPFVIKEMRYFFELGRRDQSHESFEEFEKQFFLRWLVFELIFLQSEDNYKSLEKLKEKARYKSIFSGWKKVSDLFLWAKETGWIEVTPEGQVVLKNHAVAYVAGIHDRYEKLMPIFYDDQYKLIRQFDSQLNIGFRVKQHPLHGLWKITGGDAFWISLEEHGISPFFYLIDEDETESFYRLERDSGQFLKEHESLAEHPLRAIWETEREFKKVSEKPLSKVFDLGVDFYIPRVIYGWSPEEIKSEQRNSLEIFLNSMKWIEEHRHQIPEAGFGFERAEFIRSFEAGREDRSHEKFEEFKKQLFLRWLVFELYENKGVDKDWLKKKAKTKTIFKFLDNSEIEELFIWAQERQWIYILGESLYYLNLYAIGFVAGLHSRYKNLIPLFYMNQFDFLNKFPLDKMTQLEALEKSESIIGTSHALLNLWRGTGKKDFWDALPNDVRPLRIGETLPEEKYFALSDAGIVYKTVIKGHEENDEGGYIRALWKLENHFKQEKSEEAVVFDEEPENIRVDEDRDFRAYILGTEDSSRTYQNPYLSANRSFKIQMNILQGHDVDFETGELTPHGKKFDTSSALERIGVLERTGEEVGYFRLSKMGIDFYKAFHEGKKHHPYFDIHLFERDFFMRWVVRHFLERDLKPSKTLHKHPFGEKFFENNTKDLIDWALTKGFIERDGSGEFHLTSRGIAYWVGMYKRDGKIYDPLSRAEIGAIRNEGDYRRRLSDWFSKTDSISIYSITTVRSHRRGEPKKLNQFGKVLVRNIDEKGGYKSWAVMVSERKSVKTEAEITLEIKVNEDTREEEKDLVVPGAFHTVFKRSAEGIVRSMDEGPRENLNLEGPLVLQELHILAEKFINYSEQEKVAPGKLPAKGEGQRLSYDMGLTQSVTQSTDADQNDHFYELSDDGKLFREYYQKGLLMNASDSSEEEYFYSVFLSWVTSRLLVRYLRDIGSKDFSRLNIREGIIQDFNAEFGVFSGEVFLEKALEENHLYIRTEGAIDLGLSAIGFTSGFIARDQAYFSHLRGDHIRMVEILDLKFEVTHRTFRLEQAREVGGAYWGGSSAFRDYWDPKKFSKMKSASPMIGYTGAKRVYTLSGPGLILGGIARKSDGNLLRALFDAERKLSKLKRTSSAGGEEDSAALKENRTLLSEDLYEIFQNRTKGVMKSKRSSDVHRPLLLRGLDELSRKIIIYLNRDKGTGKLPVDGDGQKLAASAKFTKSASKMNSTTKNEHWFEITEKGKFFKKFYEKGLSVDVHKISEEEYEYYVFLTWIVSRVLEGYLKYDLLNEDSLFVDVKQDIAADFSEEYGVDLGDSNRLLERALQEGYLYLREEDQIGLMTSSVAFVSGFIRRDQAYFSHLAGNRIQMVGILEREHRTIQYHFKISSALQYGGEKYWGDSRAFIEFWHPERFKYMKASIIVEETFVEGVYRLSNHAQVLGKAVNEVDGHLVKALFEAEKELSRLKGKSSSGGKEVDVASELETEEVPVSSEIRGVGKEPVVMVFKKSEARKFSREVMKELLIAQKLFPIHILLVGEDEPGENVNLETLSESGRVYDQRQMRQLPPNAQWIGYVDDSETLLEEVEDRVQVRAQVGQIPFALGYFYGVSDGLQGVIRDSSGMIHDIDGVWTERFSSRMSQYVVISQAA